MQQENLRLLTCVLRKQAMLLASHITQLPSITTALRVLDPMQVLVFWERWDSKAELV